MLVGRMQQDMQGDPQRRAREPEWPTRHPPGGSKTLKSRPEASLEHPRDPNRIPKAPQGPPKKTPEPEWEPHADKRSTCASHPSPVHERHPHTHARKHAYGAPKSLALSVAAVPLHFQCFCLPQGANKNIEIQMRVIAIQLSCSPHALHVFRNQSLLQDALRRWKRACSLMHELEQQFLSVATG